MLFTFIEIMRPFVKRRSREFSSQMAAKILKHEQAEKFHILKSHSKELEASSFNNIK